jgi:alkanesulfonate monooxygenase SsuD/methylene tetrahydromethanopterin reductase-like flavin-dependent oxidoreductase (luciferase family)
LKLGLFGANCSSGRAVTKVAERWSGGWDDCGRLAEMADAAGFDFLLPIGRWKGYGGDTDYQGATLETLTWAAGLLARTRRISVFGTVHAPLFHPIIAAKQMVTADHIGHGRFGLNIVCGWNEGEFEMFGVTQREHEARYAYAQEWLDAIKRIWSETAPFDFDGTYLKLRAVEARPKPFGGTRPVIMNAGASPTGQSFAVRNCDALFLATAKDTFDDTARNARTVKDQARLNGREIDVYTVGVVSCRPSGKEAEDYYHHCIFDNADWAAVDNIMGLKGQTPEALGREEFERLRKHTAHGLCGLPVIGDPDEVARDLAALSAAGLTGIALSVTNYNDELPYFCAEVLPRLERMGLREAV